MVLRQQQRPGEQDEAIKRGGEVAGAGAADLVRGCGGDGEDGGLRVRRDARQVAARGHRLRDQPLHAHPGEVITEPVLLSLLGLQSSCLCLLITNIERQKKNM